MGVDWNILSSWIWRGYIRSYTKLVEDPRSIVLQEAWFLFHVYTADEGHLIHMCMHIYVHAHRHIVCFSDFMQERLAVTRSWGVATSVGHSSFPQLLLQPDSRWQSRCTSCWCSSALAAQLHMDMAMMQLEWSLTVSRIFPYFALNFKQS